MAMAFEFRWAFFEGGIPSSLAAEFNEDTTFMQCGAFTSQKMQDAGVGDNVNLTLERMTSPLYTCIRSETSGFKLFQKKRPNGHEAYVVAKPRARYDFSMKLERGRGCFVKVAKALDPEDYQYIAFRTTDNIQWLKRETIRLFCPKSARLNDIEIKQFIGKRWNCNALSILQRASKAEEDDDDASTVQMDKPAANVSKPSKARKDKKDQKKKVIKRPSAAK